MRDESQSLLIECSLPPWALGSSSVEHLVSSAGILRKSLPCPLYAFELLASPLREDH